MFTIPYSLAGKRVWVAGHTGMVGGALVRRLQSENCQVLTATRAELDLTRQRDVEAWMDAAKPQAVFLAAAVVGGILANDSHPAAFLNDNLQIQLNVLAGAHRIGVEKLMFLGSSCIYPRMAPQPMSEEQLLAGPLEPTNQWYAVAKIAGIKQCQAYRKEFGRDYISCMPTNLYGPGDNFELQSGHVLPALIAKAHTAKQAQSESMTLWGTGTPKREFLYVEDMADACVFLMKDYSEDGHINIGYGSDIAIRALAELICDVVGFKGTLIQDATKPDGTPRKLLDSSRLQNLGWRPRTSLREGITRTYAWYLKNVA